MADKMKAQSAMEYLMTYGWSILIIAIVLAALFELGVFGNGNLGPKVPTGSCHVFRPGGVGSTSNINLEGTCSGELPEYAAQFNGATSYIDTGNTPSLQLGASITVSAWIYLNGCQDAEQGAIVGHGSSSYTFYVSGCVLEWAESDVAHIGTGPTIPAGTWINVVAVNNAAANVILYVNGVQSGPYSFGPTYSYTEDLRIGSSQSDIGGYIFNGLMSNIQIYNTALDPASVNAIYAEGIGGAPINLQNLVGWWPLNGDTNDYSGNGNNGVPTSVIFTSGWTTGYTTP